MLYSRALFAVYHNLLIHYGMTNKCSAYIASIGSRTEIEMGELDADFNEGVLRGFLIVDSLWSLVIWLLHGCYGNAGICLCIRHVALFAFIQSKCLTYSLAGCWHSKNFYVITCSNCKIWWRRFFSCFSRSNKQTKHSPCKELENMVW